MPKQSWFCDDINTWFQYCELETILGDMDRARAIFELAIGQPKLDMPDVLWKAYIDFEIEQDEYDITRRLYQCLLERTHHVKVRILMPLAIYHIKLQCPFVCACVCPSVRPSVRPSVFVPPLFSTRPSGHDQIWSAYADRYGNGSYLNKIAPPPHGKF